MNKDNISEAAVVLSCPDLTSTLTFFIDILGFKVTTIYPADDPMVACLVGYNLGIRLEQNSHIDRGILRLTCKSPEKVANGELLLTAPNGTAIELVTQEDEYVLPTINAELTFSGEGGDSGWITGRAGMQYRDLVPGRQSGAFIASHIRIPDGGPVPDYVHFHKIYFQMIYCYKGWVKVVYEDQGEPFIMHAGDCVIQPPQIRHRVLESSAGLEVIEVGCPAEHFTCVDYNLTLPTETLNPTRDFSGQRFVRYQATEATEATWQPRIVTDFAKAEYADLGIDEATDGLAIATVIRPREVALNGITTIHNNAIQFWFILSGELTLEYSQTHDKAKNLKASDAIVIPPNLSYGVSRCSEGLEILEVCLPQTDRLKLA